jgi:hypothetical protein
MLVQMSLRNPKNIHVMYKKVVQEAIILLQGTGSRERIQIFDENE